MTDFAQIERRLTDVLQLSRRPVAVAFRETPPDGVLQLSGSQPSGCSFWRLAAEGQVFYTVPSDHHNCPIGSYTHNIPLPPEREAELTGTLGLMVDIGYIKMEEVPGVPRLPKTPPVTVYAPLSQTPVAPDAILFAGTPARLMLLHEAATRAAKPVLPLLGRPTCMAIPAASVWRGRVEPRMYRQPRLHRHRRRSVLHRRLGNGSSGDRRRARHDRFGKRAARRIPPGTTRGAGYCVVPGPQSPVCGRD